MGKTKESLYIRIIKHIYGIHGYFDEYKKQEVNRIGNNAFLILFLLFGLEIISTSFSALIFESSNVLIVLMWSNLLIFLIILLYLAFSVSKLKLDQIETYDNKDYSHQIKKLRKKCIMLAFNFFIIERIVFFLIDLLTNDNHLTILQLIISPKENIVWGITSIIFSITLYFVQKSKIKK
ncbi:DUF3278 domain-containing protein [Apilactobacillus timberlakei]|uniref:DUF3278 domain-containing protein n=1 Tax=Apilactobacillus timberlakei TaxID=2008380 RepID=A0ABY2YUU4_9LACO|nr:DUF3278 domain-containing protein [Apilactobacillus timberlakei]TPR13308.1 DUF3278 domain-containing protein [Apilactobacillus timberlakei]TPR14353.1 DUF3278 domain-containing protein [Apilactobacillus timberlakei]TPR16606.1 DUF3278 domain-containing protein [Apilactobacillus timberlakei]